MVVSSVKLVVAPSRLGLLHSATVRGIDRSSHQAPCPARAAKMGTSLWLHLAEVLIYYE